MTQKVKNLLAGDLSSIPGSGRSPGKGDGNPLQYSCLGNPMDKEAWRATVHAIARVRHDLDTKQKYLSDKSLLNVQGLISMFVNISFLLSFVPFPVNVEHGV